MAAHSIGEPGTQMNLRTFHVAGVASVSVTQGLPRLIEIVDARRDPSTPSMIIPLTGLAAEDESLAKHVAYNIETTKLRNVATIETDITNLRLIIIPDARSMDKHDLTLDDLVDALSKIKAVRCLVQKCPAFDDSPNAVDTNLVINSDPEGEAPYAKLQEMHDAIENARIKGVDKIKRALIEQDSKTGKYRIITEGSNLREILNVEYVDKDNVMTNSILEIADVFGIEAARNSIIHEATSTLGNAGLDVDVRHIMLVADLMTNDGTVRAIGRNGVSGKKSSVLARAAFEITAAHLLHAAMVGEVDRLEGVTENIIVGQPVTLGTGAVKLVYDPKKN
jgi:DNA-directed RNA polymerase subunit A"